MLDFLGSLLLDLSQIAIKWTGFTKNNHLMSCICYTNALHAVIISIIITSSRAYVYSNYHAISMRETEVVMCSFRESKGKVTIFLSVQHSLVKID